ncbi:helix loop helix DNA-binding domain protein [Medicago truncatula]|uniref:Helix loop helix DNA-binding domain protein n=1 Tax=Medicago truncatula TaxID=3880 RepID=G7L5X8_MEDTR|nr:helix loop helix DNA-binding domain protein [Medicago truncatula]
MLQQQINNIGMENNSELFQFLVANNPSFFEYSTPSSTMMQQSFCSSSDNNNNYYHPFEVSEITDTPSQQDRALAALKNHKEAEKRRRERINSHLDHLRTLLPCNSKTRQGFTSSKSSRTCEGFKATNLSNHTTRNSSI